MSQSDTWEPTGPSAEPKAPVAIIFLTALVAVLSFLVALEHGRSLRSAVHRLPSPERTASLQRALVDLRTVCERPAEGLESHCREQAEFVLGFVECDAACRELALHQLAVQPRPR
jgi:hypothetical protein